MGIACPTIECLPTGATPEERPGQDTERLLGLNRVLQDFAKSLLKECDGRVAPSMVVYVRRRGSSMSHARFLITNQVGLLVDRGFDLLDERNAVRDVQIKHVSKPGAIARHVGNLSLAPTDAIEALAVSARFRGSDATTSTSGRRSLSSGRRSRHRQG